MTTSTQDEARVNRSCDNYLEQLQITFEDAGPDAAIEVAVVMIAAIMKFGLKRGMPLGESAMLVRLTALQLAAERSKRFRS
jgi:hypothetical protein